MKLGIVSAFPPSKITLTEYGYHLVKNFASLESVDEILLFCDETSEAKVLDFPHSDKVTVVECWQFNSYYNLNKVTKAVKKHQPDKVLFNLQFMKFGDKKVAAALGLMLPKALKARGFESTVLIHNILERVDLEKAGFTKNPLLKWIYNSIGNTLTKFILSAQTVAVTIPKYKTILENKYKKDNVVVIPHGTFEIPKVPDYPATLGATKKVMTFGKFGTYKKIEILIEAVELIRNRTDENIEIVIAGTDNPNTLGYLDAVKSKYREVSQLTFTGYVPEEDVERIFTESAVVVFPYTSTTGSSGVLHQAGSYGKSVVIPNIQDLKEVIHDEGYRGEYFDPHSAESLADAIQAILTNDAYRLELEKANYQAATAYPMTRVCQMYLATFGYVTETKINKVLA
ncbi:Glycosyltransferase [Tenacibaculum litopenaei]|uniref:glycosyltransferase n=1 Tax=Tenacibaculum litopenaei TaxID=396016 RepID=UPI003893BF42